jgi:hypothetical protein
MNKIRNLIARAGFYQGAPATIIGLYEEPTREWIETLPLLIQHPHVVIDGDDPYLWDLDLLITEIQEETVLSYIQVITSGKYDRIGTLKPDWLSIDAFPEEVVKDVYRQANELMVYVDEEMTLDRVLAVVEYVRRFEVFITFIPTDYLFSLKAIKMTCDFAKYHTSFGIPRYIEPLYHKE